MKQINLTQSQVALVDDDDYEYLNQWKWYYNNGYAVRSINPGRVFMHRFIMSTPDGMDTDHINGDRLDNRKENLRICSHTENMRNSSKYSNNKSKYKGVSFYYPNKKWVSKIRVNKKLLHLGYFSTALDAARAYDEKAKELFGEYAKLNNL